MTELLKFDPKELLWEQRYRPQTLSDCVLPESTRKHFQAMVERGDISNMLLSSYCPGTGKTTVARCLLNDLGYEYKFLAAGTGASEGGIQAMRDIEDYASTMTISGKKKAVILDEGDNLTDSAQSALRNIIERYSKSVRFIITANFPEKIMGPLHSRLQEFVFENKEEDKTDVIKQMFIRCKKICAQEDVVIDVKTGAKSIVALIQHCYPDNRDTIKRLQTYARSGTIDEGLLASLTDGVNVAPVIEAIKARDMKTLRQLAPQFKHNLPKLIHDLYKKGFDEVSGESKANFILALGEANNNAKACADVEVLIVYMFTLLATECNFN